MYNDFIKMDVTQYKYYAYAFKYLYNNNSLIIHYYFMNEKNNKIIIS
jgi:hypothetical protein